MACFITIGSTRFDTLIAASFATPVINALKQKGYSKVTVQCGNSSFKFADDIKHGETKVRNVDGLEIEFWKFKPSLEEHFDKADLVIGHAGSGTILDVLRRGKSMIVVPNPTLLDNHQVELSETLDRMDFLRAATVESLPQTILEFDPTKIKAFPAFDGSRFANIVDETMGFS